MLIVAGLIFYFLNATSSLRLCSRASFSLLATNVIRHARPWRFSMRLHVIPYGWCWLTWHRPRRAGASSGWRWMRNGGGAGFTHFPTLVWIFEGMAPVVLIILFPPSSPAL